VFSFSLFMLACHLRVVTNTLYDIVHMPDALLCCQTCQLAPLLLYSFHRCRAVLPCPPQLKELIIAVKSTKIYSSSDSAAELGLADALYACSPQLSRLRLLNVTTVDFGLNGGIHASTATHTLMVIKQIHGYL
jgi:nanoRNase/pAp phosphatase (c-di-AMP/oligoRNAs hydrolase)